MSVALLGIGIQKKASTDNYEAVTSAVDTTGANFIAIWLSSYQLTAENTISDSKGNTWVPLTAIEVSGATRGRWFYCANPTVGSGHTFSAVSTFPTVSYPAIFVLPFSGVHATPFDDESAGDQSVNANTLATGQIDPTTAGLLLAGISWYNSVSAVSIDNGFSTPETLLTSSNNIPGGVSYKIQASATAVTPAFSWTTMTPCAAIGAAFKEAAGATGNPWYAYANQMGGAQ